MPNKEQIFRTVRKICKSMFFYRWIFDCFIEQTDYGNLEPKEHELKNVSVGVERMNFSYGSCGRSHIVQSVIFLTEISKWQVKIYFRVENKCFKLERGRFLNTRPISSDLLMGISYAGSSPDTLWPIGRSVSKTRNKES